MKLLLEMKDLLALPALILDSFATSQSNVIKLYFLASPLLSNKLDRLTLKNFYG
jgi:hypothetical protein